MAQQSKNDEQTQALAPWWMVSLLLWILLVSSCIEWHDGPGPEGQPAPFWPHPMDSPTPTYTPTSTPTPTATPEALG